MKALTDILKQTVTIDQKLVLELIGYIDLTSLDDCDTSKTISALIKTANSGFEGSHPAAVCTFSPFSDLLNVELNPKINSAVVGGCFPTGQSLSEAKIEEVKLIALKPVNEIDVVLNRGDFLSEKYDAVKNEIAGMKKAAGHKHLKVILETGDLKTSENIRRASELAIEAGADFIKTSTGKTNQGASPEAVYTMCEVIHAYHEKTGEMIGIKPSGGIRTIDDALVYYKIVSFVLGQQWLSPNYFRIGASSLYTNLIESYKLIG